MYSDIIQSRYGRTYTLHNGDSIPNYNMYIFSVRNNTFIRNLRGEESVVLKFDRSPYVEVHDNVFEANGDLALYHYATDKTQFINTFTAFRTEEILLPNTTAAAGIIFSNSAFQLSLLNNHVSNNWAA